MPERIDADVCVVGAGYAGSTAAWRLHRGGTPVFVLEARDSIDGAVRSGERAASEILG